MNNIVEGLTITVIGMGVVFLVLFILILVLQLFKIFFYKEKDKGGIKNRQYNLKTGVQQDELEEVVAVVTAVMEDILDKNEYISKIQQLN